MKSGAADVAKPGRGHAAFCAFSAIRLKLFGKDKVSVIRSNWQAFAFLAPASLLLFIFYYWPWN